MAEEKPKKQYQPTRVEVIKTVIIAVLVTGIIAFIMGAKFQQHQAGKVDQAVKAVTNTQDVQAAPADTAGK